jgi:hypothetical protein
MMIVSKLITFFLSIVLLSCGSSKTDIQKLEDQTQIKEVYSQAWVAGVRGGGAGIDVYVNLNTPFEQDLVLEKIQFKTYEAPFEKTNELSYVARIDTGQNKLKTINIEVTDAEKKTVVSEPKINLKEKQAILFFKKEGKEYSKIIENVEEREMIAYPSVRKPTE